MTPLYVPNFISEENSLVLFNELMNLRWEERTIARKEYFMGSNSESYSYDNRLYTAQPWNTITYDILEKINNQFETDLNVCFLNRYDTQHHALGWHKDYKITDSSREIPAGLIAVLSFGAEREIWWKLNKYKGKVPKENRQLLGNGSLFVMPKEFQDLYLHKIPKHDRECGIRISLTYRNYCD